MSIVNGTTHLLQLQNGPVVNGAPGWLTVGCSTSDSFNSSTASLDANSKCTGGFDEMAPGKTTWSFDFSGKPYTPDNAPSGVQTFNALSDLSKNKVLVNARQINVLDANDIIRGRVFISSLSRTSADNEPVTFDATFQGTGEYFTTAV